MTRDDLINKLVARKMNANGPAKALCVCLAKKLCGAATNPPAGANPKR
jgi:hypothetical protein